MRERTLSIIKPDAVGKDAVGAITARFEAAGLRIRALKMLRLSPEEARGFYAVHRGKPFFESLAAFMSEGPVVVMVLEGEEAISKLRLIMGATNPKDAAAGTIRKDFATDIERNAVHGSDSQASARFEIPYFFASLEVMEP